MKLLSWNVNGSSRVDQQAAALLAEDADLVALQEVRRATAAAWTEVLSVEGRGFQHVVTTEHLVGDRSNFLLVASRYPLIATARRSAPSRSFEIPFPELALSVVVDLPDAELEF